MEGWTMQHGQRLRRPADSLGHFCNYCRKILSNKCSAFNHEYINYAIWYLWEHPDNTDQFIKDIKAIDYNPNRKHAIRYFNTQLKSIISKYTGGGNGMNLECSTKGDKRFSAWYANVIVYGQTNSIEQHYQFSKVFMLNGQQTSFTDVKYIKHIQYQGNKPITFRVNKCMFDISLLSAWYKSLWLKYLDANPDLVQFASQYSTFTDMFSKKGSLNSQADVIRQYIKDGREPLVKECSAFFKLLRIATPVKGKIWTLQDIQNVLNVE
jgi:hypothetical protein